MNKIIQIVLSADARTVIALGEDGRAYWYGDVLENGKVLKRWTVYPELPKE